MGCDFEKQSIQHAFIQFGSYLTEQTKIWVLARPNRPKFGYWPDRTDRNMGIRQTEQTKIATGQTECATQIFSRPLWTVAPDPLSATQVGLANTCLGSRTSSWMVILVLGSEDLFHLFLGSDPGKILYGIKISVIRWLD